jgi:hypothetical protein
MPVPEAQQAVGQEAVQGIGEAIVGSDRRLCDGGARLWTSVV